MEKSKDGRTLFSACRDSHLKQYPAEDGCCWLDMNKGDTLGEQPGFGKRAQKVRNRRPGKLLPLLSQALFLCLRVCVYGRRPGSQEKEDKVEGSSGRASKLSGAQMQLGHGFCNLLATPY